MDRHGWGKYMRQKERRSALKCRSPYQKIEDVNTDDARLAGKRADGLTAVMFDKITKSCFGNTYSEPKCDENRYLVTP